MSFLNTRYDVTISVCTPENTDRREQLTYHCNPETLISDPLFLSEYIRAVVDKLDARITHENGNVLEVVGNSGYVTKEKSAGMTEWPVGLELIEL